MRRCYLLTDDGVAEATVVSAADEALALLLELDARSEATSVSAGPEVRP